MESNNRFSLSMIFIPVLLLTALYFYFGKSKKRERSLSFNTNSMMQGSFPESAKVQEPVLSILILFENSPSMESLKKLWEPLLSYDRMRSIFYYDVANKQYGFKEVKVNYDDHFLEVRVSSEAELQSKVNAISNNELKGRENAPAWCIHRIVNTGKGYSVVVFQIHHAIADGMSLVSALSKCFRNKAGEPFKIAIPEKKENSYNKISKVKQLTAFLKSLARAAGIGISAYDTEILFNTPNRKKLVMSRDRNIIYFPIVKVDFIKDLKNKYGCTINDILYCAFSGAIRRYCIAQKDPAFASSPSCRALMAVAFPRTQEELANPSIAMCNRFTFVNCNLHLHHSTCKDRLKGCMESLLELRSTPFALASNYLQQNVLSLAPKFLQQQAAFDVFSRHSLVFSNVPGPSEDLFCGEEKICGAYAIFPNLLPQVIMVSYAGSMFINLVIDDKLVKDAHSIGKYFLMELKEFGESCGMVCTNDEMISNVGRGGKFYSGL